MHSVAKDIYENPQEWKAKGCTFEKGSLQLWTGNGFLFFGVHEKSVKLSFVDRWEIWKAYKWWCAHAPIESLV